MNLGGGYQGGSSNQRTGLSGTPYEGSAQERLHRASSSYDQTVRDIMANPLRYRGKTGAQLFPSGQFGLGQNVDQAVRQLSNQLYSRASAQNAGMGRLTPEGAEASAGSALTQALPGLIPQLMGFEQFQFGLPMNINSWIDNLQRNRMQAFNETLGGRGQSTYSGFNFSGGVGV